MSLNVMIVDDMQVYRRMLADAVGRLDGLEVTATVASGEAAVAALKAGQHPDLVLLDSHLPGMGALKTLEALLKLRPSPVVLIVGTAVAGEGRDMVAALNAGALAPVTKPAGHDYPEALRMLQREVAHCLPAVRERLARQRRHVPAAGRKRGPKPVTGPFGATDFALMAIGISTGGPPALAQVLPRLPGDFPLPVAVAQHMPPLFTALMAEAMQPDCALRLAEAREGDLVKPGTVLFAPGGRHMEFRRVNGRVTAHLTDDPPVHGVKPSADILFKSAAEAYAGARVLAVVMTGMGEDGLEGVRALKRNASYCITQSARSCAVYGMPRAVDEAGLSDISLDAEQIPLFAASLLRRGS